MTSIASLVTNFLRLREMATVANQHMPIEQAMYLKYFIPTGPKTFR
jgi:hypothetical protein